MNDQTKQILMIVAFIGSILLIGAGLYFAFFRGVIETPPEEIVAPPATETPDLPTAGEGSPIPVAPGAGVSLADTVAQGRETQTTTLTSSAVSNTAVSGNQVNYYDANDGRFYQIDDQGNVISLSEQQFPQAENVVWNGDANKAIIEFPDGSNIVYDFATQQQVTLPKHWQDFDFSDSSDQIVAKNMAVDPDNRWLVTSNADGSNVKAVQALGLNADKVQVSWSPSNKVIAFADTAEPLSGGLDRKMILPIGQNHENYKGLIIEGLGFLPNWSPDGRQLLYSASGAYSGEKPLLWIVDASPATMGENRRSLGLNTWADKCTFTSNSEAYCAVPQNLPTNAGFQRTLYRNLPDNLYQVDLATGRTSLLAIPTQNLAMENLTVSGDGRTLYFTDAVSGQLSSLKLK
ncbi:hypothetical protein KJ611_03820 [Patescibacteria group bacterium]|nr:hypothetical protein [Patescibacteria group bacterium]MBU1705718.1 hypothetical protein [Patescibacteria group bacterium]